METMRALTIQIGIFGRTNSGKSSFMNFVTGQNASIVSEIKGTTTDLVYKQMELRPLGPVTFIDTAGVDDKTKLSAARKEKTGKALEACDVIVLMCEAEIFGVFEKSIALEAQKRKTPLVILCAKSDLKKPSKVFISKLRKITPDVLTFSIKDNRNDFLNAFKKVLVKAVPDNLFEKDQVLGKELKKGDTAVLVVPIDLGAPRGRLIMPQVQTIRNVLDLGASAITVKNTEYKELLSKLKKSPEIVITDSQVVKEIVLKTPKNVRVTTFSTLLSAEKSDIVEMAKGAAAISNLKKGDKVLLAESCTHHASACDIGRVKIPKWLSEWTGKDVKFGFSSGRDYPKDLKEYKLVIHCGACVLNRKEMISRLNAALEAGVPVTNYGIAISVFQGVIEKVLEIFPDALKAYKAAITS